VAADGPERLTKLAVVQRQLRTAIRMFFEDGDTVSAYTLAAAVEGVLGGLLKKQGKAHPFREASCIKKGMEDAFQEVLNAPQNFFKHASRDPNQVFEFPAMSLEYVLFECVVLYQIYRGRELREGRLFFVWFGVHHPNIVSGEPMQVFLESLTTLAPTLATEKSFYLEFVNRPDLFPMTDDFD
jgi:hypothetical protein